MELKINVDESKFKDILEKELGAFSNEELHEILKEAMKEYLQNDETLKEVFLGKEYNWDKTYYNYKPKPILQELVSKVSVAPLFEDIQKKILDYVSSEEVVNGMAKALFGNLVENGIKNYLVNNESFLSQLSWKIKEMIGGN